MNLGLALILSSALVAVGANAIVSELLVLSSKTESAVRYTIGTICGAVAWAGGFIWIWTSVQ